MKMLNIVYSRIAKTRSGKVIPYTQSINDLRYVTKYIQELSFSTDDYLDAFAVFNFLAFRALRRSDNEAIFGQHGVLVLNFINPMDFNDAKIRANIRSAFDLRDLGKSLVAVEFMDY